MTSRGARDWPQGAMPLVAPELLSSIVARAADISIVISDMGQVQSVLVNPDLQGFGDLDDWQGRDIRETLTSESVRKLDARLAEFAGRNETVRPIELNHRLGDGREFPIRYGVQRLGPDGSIILLGRDLRPIAEMQQQLVEAQLALERDYEANREVATRLRVLLDITRDAAIYVSMASGRIVELNARAARLLGGSVEGLRGMSFGGELTGAGDAGVIDHLAQAGRAEGGGATQLVARRTGGTLDIRVTLFRASGERMLICRLDRAEQDMQTDGPMGDRLSRLHDACPDGIVFTDRAGQILSVNDGFLDLADLEGPEDVKGRSLSDFLARGEVDLRLMSDTAVRNGQMRLYSTRIVTAGGGERAVGISVTYLADGQHPALGYVLRDARLPDGTRPAQGGVDDDTMESIRALVGTASLKELVGETSDVIEKMCIETAVELTSNNRVAAAEMLGLSRQSLYVKLRKYGLLARNDD
ncbi:transcriptional regulator PpsR [Palleronia sp. LCG004]|uniref:transcriptional regulator PpsR n=1 Tax=Palleronia sp. LCG004 TaxID=3079304 RepID=UPI0029427668|nr:transcriptional regulator PpsR [Palleronia sp. LCG004]WOI56158.1 transcriptional regulator PpsR [Palleronia sp. LCG004]